MNRNSIYVATALLILIGGAGLAVFYAYLTKTQADSRQTKTFDPLVFKEDGAGGEIFSNTTTQIQTENTTESDAEVLKDNKEVPATETPTQQTKKNTKAVLEKIYDAPVAGYTFTTIKNGHAVRLAERTRGNIIDYDMETKKTTRITNTTVPGIFESLFNTDGSQVILRSLDESDAILTLSSPITELAEQGSEAENSAGSTVGTYLPINIKSIAAFGDIIAYATQMDDGQTQIVTTDFTGSKPKRVFKSPLSGWQVTWPQKEFIAITQNASFDTPGYAYTVDVKTGVLRKIASDTRALMTRISQYNKKFIQSTNNDAGVMLSSIGTIGERTKVNTKKVVVPEKCAFVSATQAVCGTPNEIGLKMPDVWFQGARIFSDSLIYLDLETGATTDIISTSGGAGGAGLDVTHLMLSPDGKHLVFIDKTSGTLWMVTLPENGN